jgi:hypothetical protein
MTEIRRGRCEDAPGQQRRHSGEDGSRKDATQVGVTDDVTPLTATGDGCLEAFDGDHQTEIAACSAEIAGARPPRTDRRRPVDAR